MRKSLIIFISISVLLFLVCGAVIIILFYNNSINCSEIAFKNITVSSNDIEIEAIITNSSKNYVKYDYSIDNGTLKLSVLCRYMDTKQKGRPMMNIPIDTKDINKNIFCGKDKKSIVIWKRQK